MNLRPGDKLRVLKDLTGYGIGREGFLVPVRIRAKTVLKVIEYDGVRDCGLAVDCNGAEIDLNERDLRYEKVENI